MGTAGTGKSYLIMAIRKMLHEVAGNETKTPLLVLAPTGLRPSILEEEQFIPHYLYQCLPPVLDLLIYASNQRDALSNDGFTGYKQFQEVYKLDSIIEDWEIFNSRIEDKQSRKERNRFSDATFILPRWIDVEQVNMEKLRSLNRPVAKILAVHTGGREAKNADSDTAKGLEHIGTKEFAAGLSFVAVSRVRALGDLLFRPFNFERLERFKLCKRLQERKDEYLYASSIVTCQTCHRKDIIQP
ncbi:hypothetical protein RhiirA4_481464 [Rhizophagus irregularis]|uniref:ATP-dependent DNA helicase n=1 Tax=Rhizophagus irregularis TaxID=588596 RepID=A0A2I1HJK6_9GLOM|nr:hypothetical protein RhiirA4_481464 [Rhizophagus irregularis]